MRITLWFLEKTSSLSKEFQTLTEMLPVIVDQLSAVTMFLW